MIPYGRHSLDKDDIDSVIQILESNVITDGSVVDEFGISLADYTGAQYCLPVCNGTAALQLAVSALDIGHGDEVITTPITFCATANVVLHQGANIRLVDIDENTLNIDVTKIEKSINKNTRAIIPVDFRGHPAALPEISQIAKTYGLYVIEDASHAIGSRYMCNGDTYYCGQGVHADFATFSFHPVKHITSGEGGAILTNDESLFRKMKPLRSHGIERKPEMFDESKRLGPWMYDMINLGFNYRLTEFQAALGLSQLKKLEKVRERRRQIVTYYNEQFADCDELLVPYESNTVDSNFHLYVLQIKQNSRLDRYELFRLLREKNYEPMVHYIPLHLLSYYQKKYGFREGDYPVAENYYRTAISIPLYPSLSDADVEKVAKDVCMILKSIP